MEHQNENSVEDRELWELDSRPVDVIAIGSQVVYGTVGLSASVPTLEARGLKVAALPTAVLSNLPHYPSVHALDISSSWVPDALADLTEVGIASEASTVYTGYFSSPQQVSAVAAWLKDLVTQRPGLRVIVDPTLGDYDVGAYTDPAVATALRDELIPLATGLVPNLFELQHLTGGAIDRRQDVESIAAAARTLLGPRGQWAVATGLDSREPASGTQGEDLVITRDRMVSVGYERLDISVKGTGDVMAASIVAGLHEGRDILDAVEAAGAIVRQRLRTRS